MSYLVTYPIRGYSVSFCDGRLFIPPSVNFDDPDYIEALKYAQKVAPVVDALHMIRQNLGSQERWEYAEDSELQWAIDAENLLRNQDFIAVPDKVLAFCDEARAEKERRDAREELKRRREQRRRERSGGYVYLIASETGHYKIGRTRNPEDRMATFGVKLPFQVEYQHLIQCDDMRALEKTLHEKFDHKRVNGEWFALAPDDVAWIKSLGGAS